METGSWEPANSALRRIRNTALAVIFLGGPAAVAAKVAIDSQLRRVPTEDARLVARDGNGDDAVKAVTMLFRDIDQSIDVLRDLASRDGPVSEQARIALQHIAARAR